MAKRSGRRYYELKAILEERRQEILESVRTKKGEISQKPSTPSEMAEQASVDLQEEIELALVNMQADTLNKIEAALRRLEEGTYGYCSRCRDEISEKRLRALPFAIRCKDCEEVHMSKNQKSLHR